MASPMNEGFLARVISNFVLWLCDNWKWFDRFMDDWAEWHSCVEVAQKKFNKKFKKGEMGIVKEICVIDICADSNIPHDRKYFVAEVRKTFYGWHNKDVYLYFLMKRDESILQLMESNRRSYKMNLVVTEKDVRFIYSDCTVFSAKVKIVAPLPA